MRLARIVAIAIAASAASLSTAHAAPQMLGVVATLEPVPLDCTDGYCSAEFSAFCLERERGAPAPGTIYRAVDAARLTVLATGADGKVRELPAGDLLRVTAERGYSAVRMGVDQDRLAALGIAEIAIEVGPAVSLVPSAADDADAHGAGEIARIAGPLRELASGLVDNGGVASDAARLMSRVINKLPDDAVPHAAGATAWRSAIGGEPDMFNADPGRAEAAFAFLACGQSVSAGQLDSLKGCLQYRHDALMAGQNLKFWEASKLGM